jgi:hypothetical protein
MWPPAPLGQASLSAERGRRLAQGVGSPPHDCLPWGLPGSARVVLLISVHAALLRLGCERANLAIAEAAVTCAFRSRRSPLLGGASCRLEEAACADPSATRFINSICQLGTATA